MDTILCDSRDFENDRPRKTTHINIINHDDNTEGLSRRRRQRRCHIIVIIPTQNLLERQVLVFYVLPHRWRHRRRLCQGGWRAEGGRRRTRPTGRREGHGRDGRRIVIEA